MDANKNQNTKGNTMMDTALPKRPCLCGRVVSVRREQQRHGGGKDRVKHNCPHGNPCVTGSLAGGNGFNVNATCRECILADTEARAK